MINRKKSYLCTEKNNSICESRQHLRTNTPPQHHHHHHPTHPHQGFQRKMNWLDGEGEREPSRENENEPKKGSDSHWSWGPRAFLGYMECEGASLMAQLWRICLQHRRHRKCKFNPWVGKIPWRRKCQPTPIFLPGKSHGERSLVGHSPWGCKELDMTERGSRHSHGVGRAEPRVMLGWSWVWRLPRPYGRLKFSQTTSGSQYRPINETATEIDRRWGDLAKIN